VVIDTRKTGDLVKIKKAPSTFNAQEGEIVLACDRGRCVKKGIPPSQIILGLITPYAAQIRFLQRRVKKKSDHGFWVYQRTKPQETIRLLNEPISALSGLFRDASAGLMVVVFQCPATILPVRSAGRRYGS